jgi:hypothetical protein
MQYHGHRARGILHNKLQLLNLTHVPATRVSFKICFLCDAIPFVSRNSTQHHLPCHASSANLHVATSRGLQTTQLLAPYLPSEGRTVSPYSEGGALYALGLIHASHGHPITEFISNSLVNSRHEVVQHGACLGIGLAAQGTDDAGIYDRLKGARLSCLAYFAFLSTYGPFSLTCTALTFDRIRAERVFCLLV